MQHINDLLKFYSSQNNFNATEDFYFFEIYLQMSSLVCQIDWKSTLNGQLDGKSRLDGELDCTSRLDSRQDEKTRWSARWDE